MRVVVHWPRYGPLHRNRMRAAHDVLTRHGHEAVAVAVASDDDVYDWDDDPTRPPYPTETLFPGKNFDQLRPAAIGRAMQRGLDRINPDAVLIHSYAMPDALAALAWCRRHRRVAICMAESKADDAPRIGWRERIKRTLVSQFDAAQAAGSAAARYHAGLGIPPERIFVGYSVVDNDYFAARAAAVRANPEPHRMLPGLANERPFFLASARFIPRKDLQTLVSAFADYRRRAAAATQDPWRLVLLGDGVLRPSVERWIAEAGLGPHVALAGWQQLDALPVYYALAGAFVHTATVDQWGLVVNEALASGLPVLVSTGAGCHEDLVREGTNGYTFRPGDVAALAARMLRLAHEDDRAALARSAVSIVGEYPLERFGTSLLAAAEAGLLTARSHGRHPLADGVTAALALASTGPRSFHSVQS